MAEKGYTAEQALKGYFWSLGFFVVRGMVIKLGSNDVTDIDLWLYNRPSPVTRERINVDIKNKRTPQALERIFWAKGVQTVLGFDSCIVATSDKRPEIIEFGREHGVTVLDGRLLKRIAEKAPEGLLTDEEFATRSASFRESRAQLGWYDRIASAKTVLGSKLGYDACNHLLAEARFFTEQVLLRGPRTAEALRYLYLSIAYFLVSLDFAVSGFPFLASDEHQRRIEDGIRYGTAGRAATEKIADVAARIASASVPNSNATAIREAVRKTSEGYPAEVLGEFFGRTSVQNSLFHLAREFNVLAYSRDLALPSDLTNESKATLLVLLDFLKVSRPEFVSVAGSARQGGSDQAEMVVKSTKRAGEVQGELRIVEGDRPDLPG